MNPERDAILHAVRTQWPEHGPFLDSATAACDPPLLETAELVSGIILRLAGDDLARLAGGYRWMCEMMLEEEIEFRRTGKYRYSRFDEVRDLVYGDRALMTRYMEGLLLSQVLWFNHARMIDFYVRRYLPRAATSAAHLEVGPGHGLLLYLAARAGAARLTGWDVSPSSLASTKSALDRLGVGARVELEQRSVLDPARRSDRYGSVVISEVLEHLEDPGGALEGLHGLMDAGGRIFVNAPVNSPALDHIYLFSTPEELVDLVRSRGFEIEETCFAPATGYTEARARKVGIVISCAVIARKAT